MLIVIAVAVSAVAVDTFVRRQSRLPFGGASSVLIGALGVLAGSVLALAPDSSDTGEIARAAGLFAVVLGAALVAVGPTMAYCSLPGRSPRLARLVSTRSSMMLGSGAALVLMWRVLTTWTPAVESGGGPTVSPEALERVDRASSQTDISPVEVSRSLAVDNLNLEVLDSLAVRSRPLSLIHI